MPYKTISFKLLRPTGVKRRMLDDALERYSRAFALLLEEVKHHLPSADASMTRRDCMRLLDRELLSRADHLNIQPFRDALKLDLSMLLALWSNGQGSYPVTRVEDEALRRALDGEHPPPPWRMDALFDKYRRDRPLLFCRHEGHRDYSLYRDRVSGRCYAKLYLFNRDHALPGAPGEPQRLVGLAPPHEPLGGAKKVRYQLFPLEDGPWQAAHLELIQAGGAVPKSALLLRKGEDYYLNVRLWFDPPATLPQQGYLGVVRGVETPLCYAVCDRDGELLATGALEAGKERGKNRLHALANQAVELAKRYGSGLVLENLVRAGDDLEQGGCTAAISHGEYTQIADLIAYKATFAGLPGAVRVSARRIYQRCPRCGATRQSNRYSAEAILCTSCGTLTPVVLGAALNLSRTLIRYQNTRIPVVCRTVGDQLDFRLRELDLSFVCERNQFAVQRFCDWLRRTLETPPPGQLSKKQMSYYRKLTSGKEMLDCISIQSDA